MLTYIHLMGKPEGEEEETEEISEIIMIENFFQIPNHNLRSSEASRRNIKNEENRTNKTNKKHLGISFLSY